MSTASKSALFQKLPATDELLRQPDMLALVEREGHSAVAESIRVVLARLRQEISEGQLDEKSLDLARGGLSEAIERQLRQSLSYSLRWAMLCKIVRCSLSSRAVCGIRVLPIRNQWQVPCGREIRTWSSPGSATKSALG